MKVVVFFSVLVAVRGETWNPSNTGWKRITLTGWVALTLGLVAALFSILQGFHEATEKERELGQARSRIQSLYISVLDSERQIRNLQMVIEELRTPIDELLGAAKSLFWEDKFTEALDKYDSLLAIDPRSNDAWIGKAFCYLSQHYGRPMSVGAMSGIADFWGEVRIESEALNNAYDMAMKALEVSDTDLARLQANVVLGLSLLSSGEVGSHGGPGGMHSFAKVRGEPAYFFVDALRIAQKDEFSGSGPPLVQHNIKMFYSTFAREGLLEIAKIGNNDWGLGRYIEEFNLGRMANEED